MYREQNFNFLSNSSCFKCNDTVRIPSYSKAGCFSSTNGYSPVIDLSIKRSNRTIDKEIGTPFILPYDKQPKNAIRKNFF